MLLWPYKNAPTASPRCSGGLLQCFTDCFHCSSPREMHRLLRHAASLFQLIQPAAPVGCSGATSMFYQLLLLILHQVSSSQSRILGLEQHLVVTHFTLAIFFHCHNYRCQNFLAVLTVAIIAVIPVTNKLLYCKQTMINFVLKRYFLEVHRLIGNNRYRPIIGQFADNRYRPIISADYGDLLTIGIGRFCRPLSIIGAHWSCFDIQKSN